MTTALAQPDSAFLDYLPASMTFEEWAGELRLSYHRSNLEQWRVAVLLTDGENRWPEWLQIAEDLGISEHRISQSRYIVNAARNLPSTVPLLALPFWHWDTIAHVKAEDREAFALRMIELQPTQKEIRAHYAEYKALKAIPPPEQPQFENGLKDGAEDDGLPLAPHGVTREGGDANENPVRPGAAEHITVPEEGGEASEPVTGVSVTVPDAQESGASGTYQVGVDPAEPGTDHTILRELGYSVCTLVGMFSPECLDNVRHLQRYYESHSKESIPAAQVIERAIGQLCTIKKDRLARLSDAA